MAKLYQAAVKAKADEWADKLAAIRRAESAREAALAPIVQRHAEELEPVLRKHDPKIEKLQSEADSLMGEVLGWLNDHGKPISLEGEKAVATYATGTKLGPRVISVKQFLEAAKAKGEAMFECIKVEVAKAEKLLGKTELDQISTRPESETKEVTLKLKS